MTRIVRYSHLILFFLLLLASPLYSQKSVLKFDHITANNGLPQNSVYSVVKDKYGFMWFSTWGGAVRYDGYSVKVYRANENDSTALSDNRINYIVTDTFLNIWVLTGNSRLLFKYNYENDNFERIRLNLVPAEVRRKIKRRISGRPMVAQNNQYTWKSDRKALIQYDKISGKSVVYSANASNPFSLTDNTINCIFIDDSENLWIGTQNGGICHSNLNNVFLNYYNADKSLGGLTENVVRSVCKDSRGRVWVGSENNGITLITPDVNDKRFTYFDENQFRNARIRFIYCDKTGKIWVGTKGGLCWYNEQTKSFRNCSSDICDPNVFAIHEDYYGNFWVGTFKGLALYDRSNDRFNCLGTLINCGLQVRAIIEDHLHRLWIATEDGGISCLEYQKNNIAEPYKCTRYFHHEGDENSLSNNRTYSLVEDGEGMIWVATNSGLSRFNPLTRTFRNFTLKNGLADDIIMGVLYDGKEHIWFSHKKGLTRMDIHNFDIRNFNMFDGLQGFEFNQNACFRDYFSGEMFFGGTNGLNSFFPDSIKINRFKPKIVLSGLIVMNQTVEPGMAVNNQVILKKTILCTPQITLNWWNRSFSIEFAALHYANPLGNKYRYKLEGFDKQWINTDAANRKAFYTQLPVGTYIFKVYGANCDGVWSDKPAALIVRILPPWWLTWWAWSVYLVLAVALIYFIFRYLADKIELRKNEEIHNAKMQFFTEISHEFRTPLTLIIDPLEKLTTEEPDPQTLKKYYALMLRNAQQLLLLINQLLDFRKIEAGKLTLNLQCNDIISFIKSVIASFEAKANEQNIRLYLNLAVEKLELNFDPAKMNMILNNLISNSFKYTSSGGEIGIIVEVDNSEAYIKVKDSGTGISEEEQNRIFDIFYQSPENNKNKQGSGIGLALSKELVLLHGGTISVESETGKGSCFVVTLPVKKSDISINTEKLIAGKAVEAQIPNIKWSENESAEKPLLLMVDDNSDIREYAGLNLMANFRVEFAVDGRQGFNVARDLIPDIIVSDVMMPVMDGFEMCRLLKSDERTSHIPIILLTARHSDEAKTEGYETGADAYVTKPFNTKVLIARINNLLEQRQRLREIFSKGTSLEMKKIAVNGIDESFLNKVVLVVEQNLENEDFDIDLLAEKLTMSRSQFYRKIKALTNKTLLEFVTTIRMNKALEYLVSGEFNISETAYKVGFSQPTNFTRTFTRHFGTSPSSYLESRK